MRACNATSLAIRILKWQAVGTAALGAALLVLSSDLILAGTTTVGFGFAALAVTVWLSFYLWKPADRLRAVASDYANLKLIWESWELHKQASRASGSKESPSVFDTLELSRALLDSVELSNHRMHRSSIDHKQ